MVRMMTANIWGDYFGNPVAVREIGLYDALCAYHPDVLGLQEVTTAWHQGEMFRRLAEDYVILGDAPNYVPLAVKREFAVLDHGYELLTDTPDESKGITWVVVRDPQTDRVFGVCNTHFWWKAGPEHDVIRLQNAAQLHTVMNKLAVRFGCPVFAFGDMNCTRESGVFAYYEQHGIRPLFDLAAEKDDISSHHGDPVADSSGTYHGHRTDRDQRASIDHMVAVGNGFAVRQYRLVLDQSALDATDHSPVYADVIL